MSKNSVDETEIEMEKSSLSASQNSYNKNNSFSDVSPQHEMDKPCSCGDKAINSSNLDSPISSGSFVYAIGRIHPRFPSVSVEKEFMQAVGRAETKGLTIQQL